GLVELRACTLADDEDVGLAGDAPGDLGAEILEDLLEVLPLVPLERAGDDDGLAVEGRPAAGLLTARARCAVVVALQIDARRGEIGEGLGCDFAVQVGVHNRGGLVAEASLDAILRVDGEA